MTPLLEVQNLTMRFGGLTAVDSLNFKVEKGNIHGLIGPNGAGKTTTFNMVSGFYKPSQGRVLLNGQDISGLPMHEVANRGVVRTFQHSTLFGELSVLDNALIGTHMTFRPNLLKAILGLDSSARRDALDRARTSLEFFGLADVEHETFTGMNPEETRRMMGLMRRLCAEGTTILLVEHDMQAIMGLCDNITCMSFGKFLAEGSPAEIRNHPDVIEAYLGGARHVA